MGILAAAQNAAVPIFGLFAGVLADRRRRMPLLVFADLARALLLISVPLSWWTGHLSVTLLVVVSFLSGAFGVIFDVTRQSIIPTLVDREHLVDANGKVYLSETAADLTGPGLAGAMVQLFGAPAAILVDAISYFASALLLMRMKLVEQIATSTPWSLRIIGREIAEGYRAVVAIPILRTMSFSVAAGNLFENARNAVLILFMTRELDFSASWVGIIYAIGGAGFFIGALLPGQAANRLGLGRAITFGLILLWIGDVLFPFAGGPKLLAAAILATAMFIFGVGGSIFDINQFSLRQAVTPDPCGDGQTPRCGCYSRDRSCGRIDRRHYRRGIRHPRGTDLRGVLITSIALDSGGIANSEAKNDAEDALADADRQALLSFLSGDALTMTPR